MCSLPFPSASTFKERARLQRKIRPSIKYGKRMAVNDHPRRARLPIVQYIISLIVCFDMVDRKETTAPRKLCITTPARIRLCVGILRPSRARASTNHNVSTPVRNATSGKVQIPISAYCNPKKIRKAAPTDAPDDTPSVTDLPAGYEEPLEARSGDGQRCTHEYCKQHPREPDLPYNLLGCRTPVGCDPISDPWHVMKQNACNVTDRQSH